MSIERFDARHKADVEGVADLHTKHLPDSPVVRMGPRFLRRFYYSVLVQKGLIECTVCRVDGRIAGFISYTKYPFDFMVRGMRSRFVQLGWLLATSVLARPAMVRDIIGVWHMMRERRGEARETSSAGVGEVLSLAALPEYQNHVPPGGTSRMTVRLFEQMVEYFRKEGFERIHLLVQPSNRASNLFCMAMGCEFGKVVHAGVVTHRYTYHLLEQPRSQRAAVSVQ